MHISIYLDCIVSPFFKVIMASFITYFYLPNAWHSKCGKKWESSLPRLFQFLLWFKRAFSSSPECSLKFHNKRKEIKRTQNAEGGKRKKRTRKQNKTIKNKTKNPMNLDLVKVGPEPSALAEPVLGWEIRLQTSRNVFQPQLFCDLLSTSMQCKGRVTKPAKCFCRAFVFHPWISHSQTVVSIVSIKQLGWRYTNNS